MSFLRPSACAATLLLAGCAGLPAGHGYLRTSELIQSRAGAAPDAERWATPDAAPIPTQPLSAEQAIALAFAHNPRIREQYARLGLARGEVEDARRIANPTFGFARLRVDGSEHPKITRGLSFGFADVLMLPMRKRLAAGEMERVQNSVAGELLTLATDVEIAWLNAVGARQVHDLRSLVAKAGDDSAELASRYFDAGNISRLQLEQERAVAAQARIEAVRALSASLQARSQLAALVGLPADAAWDIDGRLPAPPGTVYDATTLGSSALQQRLDLAAARQSLSLREDALGSVRRWRWLGSIELGYERERDGTDGISRGPTVSLGLPIFDQGQGTIARGQAELVRARAALDALELGIANDSRLAVQRLNVAREIAEHYRVALVPAREAIVARTQEQVNFMLVGIFELIRARQEEFDAYQAYLEAVRDFWIARAQLRGIVGGSLPDDGDAVAPTLGVDDVLRKPATSPTESGARDNAEDPHAGHGAHPRAPSQPSAPPEPAPEDPPPHAHQHVEEDHGDTP